MKLVWVYVTAGDVEEAKRIGRTLVEERLAACANVMDGALSLYWWEGSVQESSETILVLKTRESLLPALVDRAKSVHSYDCPCVVSLPILGGNPEFLDWLRTETRPPVNLSRT